MTEINLEYAIDKKDISHIITLQVMRFKVHASTGSATALFVLRWRRWRVAPEVEIVGIAPRAIRIGTFANSRTVTLNTMHEKTITPCAPRLCHNG